MNHQEVCFFLGGLSGGGAERVVCELSDYLIKKGFEVTIITMSDDSPSYPINANIKREILLRDGERKNFLSNSLLRLKRVYSYIKKNRFSTYIGFLPTAIIILLLMRNVIKGRIIVSERSDPNRYNIIIKLLIVKLGSRANAFVFQTDSAKQYYISLNSHIKGVVIPNGIKTSQYLHIDRSEGIKRKIVSVGRLNKVKNHSLLIESFADLEEKDIELHIYGDGELKEELQIEANDLGISERVIFHGFVKNIQDEISDALLFVLSSDHEGMPNALMEAMCMGIPCISTDCPIGGPKSLIQDGKNGLLVPVGKKIELTTAMEKLINDSKRAEMISRNSVEDMKNYDFEIVNDKWLKLMK